MTLDRATVRLTKAASAPGVAFVALSRVRHPDHLLIEDDFPDMATIMKQKDIAMTQQNSEQTEKVLLP